MVSVVQNVLEEVNITLNKNGIPYEQLSPFKTSGIRVGSPAITSRGMGEAESRKIAGIGWFKLWKITINLKFWKRFVEKLKPTDAFPLY